MKLMRLLLIGIGFSMIVRVEAQTPRAAHGGLHTLAITPHGRVIASGENLHGQLGIGNTTGDGGAATYHRAPVEVILPATNGGEMLPVIAVAAGTSHSLALASNGKVFAWGRNNLGQLGQGNTVNSSTPLQVAITSGVPGAGGLPNPATDPVVAIAAGENHCMARTQTGKVYVWGLGTSGQIGNGASTTQNLARQVTGAIASQTVSYIAAGGDHCIAIAQNGVWTWGLDANGQLGQGSSPNLNVPTKINNAALTGATRVAGGGNHTLALVGTSVYAWGLNSSKQVANTATASYANPQLVTGLAGLTIIEIAAGNAHNLAISVGVGQTSGMIMAWGANGQGQLSDGTTTVRGVPVFVFPPFPGTGYFTKIAAGGPNSSGFKSDGSLAICGDNSKGQCGNTTYPTAPVDQKMMIFGIVPGEVSPSNHTASWASYNTAKTMALKPTGRSWIWGGGAHNAGTTGSVYSVQMAAPPLNAWRVRTTEEVLAWLTYEGKIWSRARLGIPGTSDGLHGNNSITWSTTPVNVLDSGGNPVIGMVDMSFGQFHAAAVSIDGKVYTWGRSPGGGATNTTYANQVAGITGAKTAIAVGTVPTSSTIVLKNDGTIWNVSGGVATASGVTGVSKLFGTRYRAVGLDAAGSPVFIMATPGVPFGGISGLVEAAVGAGHWIGVKADGSVWTWGINWDGQIGNGTIGNYEVGTPTRVTGLGKTISVSAGDGVSIAVAEDGTLRTWGRNEDYDLGDGIATPINKLRPVIVQNFDYRPNPGTDIDGDGMPDAWETTYFGSIYGSDGIDGLDDADGDGLSDLNEYLGGSNPLIADVDNDGLNDLEEQQNDTSFSNPDTDGDDMLDGGELAAGLNPLVNDAGLDSDGDGTSNLNEYIEGTNPFYRVNLQVFTPLQN